MAEPNIDFDNLEISFPVASETPYQRYDPETKREYLEVLRCTDEAIDFTRLNAGASVLKNHNDDDVIGTVIQAWIEDAKLWVRVRLRQADEKVRQLFADMAAGILRNVSIGYLHDDVKRDGEFAYVTRWTPLEVSMAVGVPADPNVGLFRKLDEKKVLRRTAENITNKRNEEMDEKSNLKELQQQVDALKSQIDELKSVEESDEFITDDSEEKLEKTTDPADGGGASAPNLKELQQQVDALKSQIDELKSVEESDEFITDDSEEKLDKECTDAPEIRSLGALAGVSAVEVNRCIKRNMSLPEFRSHIKSLNINPRKDNKMSKYSLLRALQSAAGLNVDARIERQASDELYNSIGLASSNPNAIMVRANEFLGTGAGAQGAGLIGTDHRGDLFVEMLRQKMGVQGFTALTGLRGNVEIPVQTAHVDAEVIAINGELTNQQPAVGTLNLSPKKFGATVTIGKDLLAQSNPDAVAFVIRDIEAQIARKLDQAILVGNSSPAITGVAGTTGVQTVAIADIAQATWADMLAFYGKIGQYDLSSMPAWVMSAADAQTFKGISKGAGGGRFVLEDGQIDGLDVNISGMISTGSIFLGNWANVLVGQWGGLELIVDPYTQAKSGMLVVTATLLADVGIRNPEGFVMRVASA